MPTMLSRRGFTLTELLVTLAVTGILIALLLPAVQAARSAARRTKCQNNLHHLALAVHEFEGTHGRYPPGQFLGKYGEGPDSKAWSWIAHLLPHLEQESLHAEGNIPRATLRESGVADRQLEMLLCPEDGNSLRGPRTDAGNLAGFAVGQTNYKAVCGANWGSDSSQRLRAIGTDWPNRGTRFNGTYDGQDHGDGIMFRTDYRFHQRPALVRDGLSNTLMIGEVLPERDRWCSWPYSNNAYATCAIPPNVEATPGGNYKPLWWPNVLSFRSLHSTRVVGFALADGSARLIADDVSLDVYRALATTQGNEISSLP